MALLRWIPVLCIHDYLLIRFKIPSGLVDRHVCYVSLKFQIQENFLISIMCQFICDSHSEASTSEVSRNLHKQAHHLNNVAGLGSDII